MHFNFYFALYFVQIGFCLIARHVLVTSRRKMNNLEISRPPIDSTNTRDPNSEEHRRILRLRKAFQRLIDTCGRWWLQVQGNGYIGLSAWYD